MTVEQELVKFKEDMSLKDIIYTYVDEHKYGFVPSFGLMDEKLRKKVFDAYYNELNSVEQAAVTNNALNRIFSKGINKKEEINKNIKPELMDLCANVIQHKIEKIANEFWVLVSEYGDIANF